MSRDPVYSNEDFHLLQPAPTAELDRSDDKVYQSVMGLVKVVVQLKNDIAELKPEQYISIIQVRFNLGFMKYN